MKNNGITLVALIVTIIILLILAGITILQLTDNGLFENSKIAKSEYENATVKEEDMLKQYENAIDNGEMVNSRETETVIVNGKIFGMDLITEGEGTEESPYIIASKEQLEILAILVGNGNTFEGKYFKLDRDIQLNSSKNWVPIGNSTNKFQGIFDGNGKKISGIKIGTTNNGLFGTIGNNGVVKKVIIEGNNTVSVENCGGIASVNYGLISKCTNKVVFNNSNINRVGGIAGTNYGTIEKSCNLVKISARDAVGGIVGKNAGTINQCYNKGQIIGTNYSIGGICGFCGHGEAGYIFNSYNNASVTNGGGIIGHSWDSNTVAYIYGSYTINNTTKILGGDGTSNFDKTYTTDANNKISDMNSAIDSIGGTNTEQPWEADDTTNPINGGYPILSWQKD